MAQPGRKKANLSKYDRAGNILYREKTWQQFQKQDEHSDCILWTGALHRQGYGFACVKNLEGKSIMVTAHRLAMRIKLAREIDSEEMVLHTCNNLNCVNPDHLEIGDHERMNEIGDSYNRKFHPGKKMYSTSRRRQMNRPLKYTIEEMYWVRNNARTRLVMAKFNIPRQKAQQLITNCRVGGCYGWLDHFNLDDTLKPEFAHIYNKAK